jgi:hypothetical protein
VTIDRQEGMPVEVLDSSTESAGLLLLIYEVLPYKQDKGNTNYRDAGRSHNLRVLVLPGRKHLLNFLRQSAGSASHCVYLSPSSGHSSPFYRCKVPCCCRRDTRLLSVGLLARSSLAWGDGVRRRVRWRVDSMGQAVGGRVEKGRITPAPGNR